MANALGLDLLATCLTPALGAGLVFAMPSRTPRFLVLFAATLGHLAMTARLWTLPRGGGGDSLLGVDAPGLLVLSVLSLLYAVVGLHLFGYTKREPRGAPRVFLACHLLSLAAMSVATLSRHWGLFWVAMEATTLTTAPLLFYHHGPRSLEATWKYVLICSVGIALALLGTLFLAMSATGLGEREGAMLFEVMQRNAPRLERSWLRIGAVFLLVGYGTKMGLAPMHAWKPDAYGEAPPPVSALLSGGLANCGFLALFRLWQLCGAAGEGGFLSTMLQALGLFSLAVAAASIVGQSNYRRLLAYSSVEHMGILALSLGIGGPAVFGGLLHLVNNALNKGVLFLAAGNVLQHERSSEVKDVGGLLRALPGTGACLLAGLFAATGFPPFGTFVSEFTILAGMVRGGHAFVTACFLVLLGIVFVGMSRIVLAMVHGTPRQGDAKERGDARGHAARGDSLPRLLPMLVLLGLVVWLGVHIPAPLRQLLEEAARGAEAGR